VPAAITDRAWCTLWVQRGGAAGASNVSAVQEGHPAGFAANKAVELCLPVCCVVEGAVPDCVVLGVQGSLDADLDTGACNGGSSSSSSSQRGASVGCSDSSI
jgi:hypothetical protein